MYIALDIETTGFDPTVDQPIEIAAVRFDEKGIYDQFHTLINPGIRIPEAIRHITGIRQSDVENAPQLQKIGWQLLDFVGNDPIVGHNISFDINFLKKKGIPIENPMYDTLALSSILLPKFPSYSLETLTAHFKISKKQTHRALDDVLINVQLLQALIGIIEEIPQELDKKIKEIISKTDWPLKHFFLERKPKKKSKEISSAQERGAEHMSEEQKIILEKIKEILEKDGSLLLEAGVATGKYKALGKAITEHAKKKKKERFLILTDSDRIEMRIAENIPDVVFFEKEEHYVSPRRFWKFVERENHSDVEIAFILKILLWLNTTEEGLKEELTLQTEERTLWEFVNHEHWSCNDEKAFYHKAQEKIRTAQILLGNHNVLAELLFEHEILKNIGHVIVVEAEKLEDNMRRAVTRTYSFRHLERKIIDREQFQEAEKKLVLMFGMLGIFFEKYNNGAETLILEHAHTKTKEWKMVKGSFEKLWKIISEDTTFELKKLEKELQPLNRLFFGKNKESYVLISDLGEGEVIMRYMPFDEMKTIWSYPFFIQNKSLIFMSETLRVDKKFDYIKGRLQLQKEMEEVVVPSPAETRAKLTLFIPENFPKLSEEKFFRESVRLFKLIVEDTPGQTIGLFSSKRSIHATYYELHEPIKDQGISLISQDFSGGKGKMQERYKLDPDHAALMGSLGFFEKMHIAELPCKNLFIQKLPFDSEQDASSLIQQMKLIDPFNELTVPQTIIRFLSIVNDFLKTEGEEKNVYLLDNRILKKEYGKTFLNSLPEGVQVQYRL